MPKFLSNCIAKCPDQIPNPAEFLEESAMAISSVEFEQFFNGHGLALNLVPDWKSAVFGVYAFYLKMDKPILENTKPTVETGGSRLTREIVLNKSFFDGCTNDYQIICEVHRFFHGKLTDVARTSILATLSWLNRLYNSSLSAGAGAANPILPKLLSMFGRAIFPGNEDSGAVLKFLMKEIEVKNGQRLGNFRMYSVIRRSVEGFGERPIPMDAFNQSFEGIEFTIFNTIPSKIEPTSLVLQIRKALAETIFWEPEDYDYLRGESAKQLALDGNGMDDQQRYDARKQIALDLFKSLTPFQRAILKILSDFGKKCIASDQNEDASTISSKIELNFTNDRQADQAELVVPLLRFMIEAPDDFPAKKYMP